MTTEPPSPRFEHEDLPAGVRLAVHSTKKMKTVLVHLSFAGNLEDRPTERALLSRVLRRGTRGYPSLKDLQRRKEELYGAGLGTYVQKIGEWHLLRFRLDVVNERFLPGGKGLLERAMRLLLESVEAPLVVDGGFDPEYLREEKLGLERSIEGVLDDKDAYASKRLREEMCRGEAYRISEEGRIEDIPSIDARTLLRFHEEWTRRCPLRVYVVGDIDARTVRDLFLGVFGPWLAHREESYALSGVPPRVPIGDLRRVTEAMSLNQSKLLLGFRHGMTFAHEDNEAFLVMNALLGASGFPGSRLFRNVREKAGLAYGIHSSLERTKGLLTVAAGIAPDREAEAEAIILRELEALQRGDASTDELGAARATLLDSNRMLEDNLGALADVDLIWSLHGLSFDGASYRSRISSTGVDEATAAARRLELDTVYILAP